MFRYFRLGAWMAILVLVATMRASAQAPSEIPSTPEVRVRIVKYVEMGDAVKQFKGKIVVVDLWSLT